MQKIKVGISACLLGQPVRFNGAHKNAPLCSETLSQWFDFVPICPEVEIGMGVPREPIQLVMQNRKIRVKNVSDQSLDYTSQLTELADQKSAELSELCGFILMQKSPTCGLHDVKIYNNRGVPQKQSGTGVFANQLKQHHSWLPLEDVERLAHHSYFHHFITRVFANHHWRKTVMAEPIKARLMVFHQCHQLLLQTHSECHSQQLNALLVESLNKPLDDLLSEYFSMFSDALSQSASPIDHAITMASILQALNSYLAADVKDSIAELIDRYVQHKIQLSVPLNLLKHYVELFNLKEFIGQKYLQPYPQSLWTAACLNIKL